MWIRSVLLVAAVIVCWSAFRAARDAWDAELNLHATLFTIRLVEEFVHEKGRWPVSWEELERLTVSADPPRPRNGKLSVVRIGGSHGHEWPREAEQLQNRVAIDFSPDIAMLIVQDPMEFDAVKPIGRCFSYRKYGFVESLQSTLQAASQREATAPEPQ